MEEIKVHRICYVTFSTMFHIPESKTLYTRKRQFFGMSPLAFMFIPHKMWYPRCMLHIKLSMKTTFENGIGGIRVIFEWQSIPFNYLSIIHLHLEVTFPTTTQNCTSHRIFSFCIYHSSHPLPFHPSRCFSHCFYVEARECSSRLSHHSNKIPDRNTRSKQKTVPIKLSSLTFLFTVRNFLSYCLEQSWLKRSSKIADRSILNAICSVAALTATRNRPTNTHVP